MAYVKQFTNPYPDGWVDLPSEETPIDASALQAHTDALDAIDDELVELTTDSADWLRSRNLFDKNDTKLGFYSSNGTFNGYGGFVSQDIPIESSTTYAITSLGDIGSSASIVWLDSNHSFISLISTRTVASPQIVTSPSNAKYMGVSVKNTELDIFQVEQGTVATTYQAYSKSNAELTEIVDDAKADGYIAENLFDKTRVQLGYYNSNGAIVTSSSGWSCEAISIESGETYTISCYSNVWSAPWHVWLDANKNFISRIRSRNETYPYTAVAPSNAKYMGVSLVTLSTSEFYELDIFSVEKGATHIPSNTELGTRVDALDTVTSGNCTSSTNIASTYRMRLRKCGNIVSINFYFGLNAISDDLAQWYDLFQLPSGFYNTDNNLDFMLNDFNKNSYQGMVTNTGMIRFVPKAIITQGRLCIINLTYILG